MRAIPPPGPIYLRAVLVFTTVLGIGLQVLQTEDATPHYRYFTVWGATILCVHGAGLFTRAPLIDAWAGVVGTTAAVFSGIVYLTVLAPLGGFGKAPLTIASNLVLHVGVPSVAMLVCWRLVAGWHGRRKVASLLLLPGVYIVWSLSMYGVCATQPAYDFLRPTQVGVAGLIAAVVAGAFGFLVTAFLLRLLSRRVGAGARSWGVKP